jgi:Glycosyltransferase family 87
MSRRGAIPGRQPVLMLTPAAAPTGAHAKLPTYATAAFILIALLPPLLVLSVLWIRPIAGLTADRTAMAARDYTDMWAAGHFVAIGNGEVLFDRAGFNAGLRALFGAGFPDQMWPYPPPILLLAVPLSALPLGPGFLLYAAGSTGLLWLVLRYGGMRRTACWAILLSPAVAENALAGQNGALTGALLLGGLFLADRRPVLAGIMLGALIIKPQLGVLAPVCLLASGNWRALAAMTTSAILLIALSDAVFGLDTWVGFFRYTQPMVSAVLHAPWQGLPWQRIFASPLMAARSMGAGLPVAWSLQAAVVLLCVALVWRVWCVPSADPILRASLTGLLALAAAPWVHTYDMIPLSVAVVVLTTAASRDARLLLAFAWFWPGTVTMIPIPMALSVASIAGVAWLAWHRVQGGIDVTRRMPGRPLS